MLFNTDVRVHLEKFYFPYYTVDKVWDWVTHAAVDVTRQTQAESKAASHDDELRRLKAQVEELTRQVQELNGLKARLTHENFELHRQVQELDSNNAALAKVRAQLQQQLDEAKARLEEESRVSDASQYLRCLLV